MAQAVEYDAIVLDLMLPGLDGVEVCRRWRENGVWAPVLMLTARDAVEDRVAGSTRAPTTTSRSRSRSPSSLLGSARSCAAGRRSAPPFSRSATFASTRRRTRCGEVATEIELSGKEFALLETFMRRPGDVLSRLQLLEHAWDYAYENRSNVVDVYVRYLREKVDRPFARSSIETVRGVGYRLRKDGKA